MYFLQSGEVLSGDDLFRTFLNALSKMPQLGKPPMQNRRNLWNESAASNIIPPSALGTNTAHFKTERPYISQMNISVENPVESKTKSFGNCN